MSGSGGEDVKVTIGADATKYVDGTGQAADASGKLAASLVSVGNALGSGRSKFVSASQDVAGLAANLLKAGVSAADVNKYLGITTTAANAVGAATAKVQAAAQSFGSLAVPQDQAAAAAAKLEATIARVMSGGLTPLPAAATRAAQAISTVAQAAATSAAPIDTAADAMTRADAAARRVLAGLSPAAIAALRMGTAASSAAPAVDAEASATLRLDDAARRVVASLSPAARAMLQAGAASAEAATATDASATATAAASMGMQASSAGAARAARLAAQEALNASAAIASTSAPLKAGDTDYANIAASMLKAGATAKDVSAAIGLPIINVQKFAAALKDVLRAQTDTNNATQQTTTVTTEMTAAMEAAARLDLTVAKALASLAAEQRNATTAANEATTATKALGSANEKAGEQLISAGSKFASAGQNVTALYKALIEAGDSAEAAAKKLGLPAPKLDETDAAAQRAGRGSSMMTMELIRLGHEGMTGNWTRIPGSLMVLVEYSDTARTALSNMVTSFSTMQLAGVGALLAVGAAFVAMVLQAHAATVAINEATAAATMQGRSPAQAREEMKQYGATMREVGVMGESAINQVGSAISQLSELSSAQKNNLSRDVTALFLNWDSDAKKTGEELSKIFASTSSLENYAEKQHLFSAEQQRAWAAATDAATKYDIGLAAVHARLGPIGSQIKQQAEDAKMNMANAIASAGLGIAPMPMQGKGNLTVPQHLGDYEPGTKQQSPASVADNAAVIELNKHTQELTKLKADLQHAQNALTDDTKAGNAVAIAADQTAIKTANDLIQMWKGQGDASWAQKQTAALDLVLDKVKSTGKTTRAYDEEVNKARVKFWEDAAKQAGLTEGEILTAQRAAATARRALVRENLTDATQGARQALQAKLAALTEEQAANHDDYAKVMQIEQQKLALLQSAGKEGTKLYEQELIKRDELRRAHATQQAEIARETLTKERAQDASELSALKAALDVEVTAQRISKAEEERALQAYAQQQQQIEIDAQQAYIDLVRGMPKEYQAALDQMSTMKAQFAARDAQYNAKMVADQKASWDKMTSPIEGAISGQIGAVLRGTDTMSQAVYKMAGNIVVSYAQMAAKAGLEWAGLQLMEILWTGRGEAGKTGAAVAGSAARTAVADTEAARQNAGLLVRLGRWISTELGFTTATTGGNAARQASDTEAAVASRAAQKLLSVGEVTDQSVIAGAAAFADSAMLGPAGLAAAPAAAAAASGTVLAMGSGLSLAVGAWNLPSDVSANLHAGEMVVPANFASGLRGALAGGGAGGATQNLNYSPTINGGGGADIAGAMRGQAAAFKAYLWHATRNGSLTLPGR